MIFLHEWKMTTEARIVSIVLCLPCMPRYEIADENNVKCMQCVFLMCRQ